MDKQKPQENFFSFFRKWKKNESPKEYICFHDITRREMERVNTQKINDDTVEVIVTLLKMKLTFAIHKFQRCKNWLIISVEMLFKTSIIKMLFRSIQNFDK